MARPGERRQRLLAMLDGGNEPTLQEIVTGIGLRSVRHARRMLAEIRADGMSIVERRDGRRKRFSLSPEHRSSGVAALALTEEEILSLAVAAEASRAALRPTPLGNPLETAFAKLLGHFDADVYSFDVQEEREHWHFGAGAASAIDPRIFRTLEQAIREQQRVLIDYTTASTGRHSTGRPIEPYALAVRGGSWLVVARCGWRNDVRDFSVAGITRIEPCDPETDHTAIFTPPDFDLDEYFRQRFSALAGDRTYTIRLLVEPDRVVYFQRKRYHTSQNIEEEREDGRAVVSLTASSLDEMRSFAQSWGVGVTVLEPVELVEMMREEAGQIAARYKASPINPQLDSR
ncbi:MAG TPA: WYL domain-containing protein [Candidatus Kapabacteria bacterium]|nr:WYL domain-containing protein [Candidatus Kapabacteria bacterium]